MLKSKDIGKIPLIKQKYYIVHYTTKKAYENILISKHILTNTSTINYELPNIFSFSPGFGNINKKKIGNSKITLTDSLDDIISNNYTEAHGVYFRMERNITSFVPDRTNCTIKIILNMDVLHAYEWYINTEENNGFYFGDINSTRVGLFGGYLGKTITNLSDIPENYDETSLELILLNNVHIKHILLAIDLE